MIDLQVNDEVSLVNQKGRFVVMKVEGGMATLQLFADDTRSNERIYFEPTIEARLENLKLIGKNHSRPTHFRVEKSW